LGARTVLNPAPAQSAPADVLELPDVVVVNETELAFFSGTEDVVDGLRAMCRRRDQLVVATLGAHGVAALIGDEVVRVPGHEVPVLDTTGAGDCFVGALAAAMCSWAEIDEAIHFANLAASLAVQRLGAGTGMPHLSDVERVT
jgi:ribokinase